MMYYPGAGEASNGGLSNLLSAILYGGKCLGYRKLSVGDTVKQLSDIEDPDAGGPLAAGIPAGSAYAIILVEADASQADLPRVVRFTEDGVAPTGTEGMPVGDNGSFEVKGENLQNLKVIGITVGKTHTLRIQFYGQA